MDLDKAFREETTAHVVDVRFVGSCQTGVVTPSERINNPRLTILRVGVDEGVKCLFELRQSLDRMVVGLNESMLNDGGALLVPVSVTGGRAA